MFRLHRKGNKKLILSDINQVVCDHILDVKISASFKNTHIKKLEKLIVNWILFRYSMIVFNDHDGTLAANVLSHLKNTSDLLASGMVSCNKTNMKHYRNIIVSFFNKNYLRFPLFLFSILLTFIKIKRQQRKTMIPINK